jgi:hypothetical protein
MRSYVVPDSDPAYFHRSAQHQTPHRNAELRSAGVFLAVIAFVPLTHKTGGQT